MRSLFLKIFLWFGLAMVLVNIASFFTGIVIERRSQTTRTNPMAPMFGIYAQTAVEVLERDGRPALAAYLQRVESASHIHAAILDDHENEVSTQALPAGALEIARRAAQSPGFVFDPPRQQRQPLVAQAVQGPSGTRYFVVAELPRPNFPGLPPRIGEPGSLFFGLRMLTRSLLPLLLIGALFCYWLAR
jgi:hypothetical protein